MKVLIIGYGSMGRRRIRLLKKMETGAEIICVDSHPDRLRQIAQDGFTGFGDIEDAIATGLDLAFVCTPPGSHAGQILRLVDAGIHTFTELNLADTGYGKIIELSKKRKTAVFMSGTMLYDRRIEKIDEIVRRTHKPLTYIYHVGQYLPDWHPWENYQDFFAGQRETNGVREIYAVQLPWVIHTFGEIEAVTAEAQKASSLDIDFPDSVIASFRHKNGNMGVFVADVVSRKAITELEVIGEDIHLFWHGHNDDLFLYDMEKKQIQAIPAYEAAEHADGYSDNIIENQYADEVRDFLDTVYRGTVPRYSLEKDLYTLSVINEIEEKSRDRLSEN